VEQGDRELRTWAQRCAETTEGFLAESTAWKQIAERGHEWKLAKRPNGTLIRGGPLLTPRECFRNAARIVGGLTAYNPAGCQYAEGFTLTEMGFWSHHAWVITPGDQVIERTWKTGGQRYVGVTIDLADFPNYPGSCQLSEWPLGFAWAPSYLNNPETLQWLRSSLLKEVNTDAEEDLPACAGSSHP